MKMGIHKYKCGHESKPVITESSLITISAWIEWKDTVGFNGDDSLCWECWCKKQEELKT